ncbi:hypothetical protein CSOJ01_14944, partial [Colletotrichum sojae]
MYFTKHVMTVITAIVFASAGVQAA